MIEGDDAPRSVFPTVVGTPKQKDLEKKILERYVGDEAQSKRGILDLNRPLKKGLIQNWEEIEKIYHHILYNELKVAPEEHPLLLSESALNLKKDREKLAQIMFEKFDTPALLLYSSSTLSVFASGRTTALSLDYKFDLSCL